MRHPGDDERQAPPGDEDAERGAGERDAERFGEELTDHARAIGADGGADGEFVLAFGAAGEEKDGDVAAADEEQRGDGAEENVERGAERAGVQLDDAAQADAEIFGIVLRGVVWRNSSRSG